MHLFKTHEATMTADIFDRPTSRPLKIIFKEHLDNTIECCQTLNQLFMNLDEPDPYVAKVKQLEEKGDKLTAESYCALELLTYSEFISTTEQFVNRLDDIIDGINNTARLIDICHPRQIENAAHEILSTLVSMLERLQTEISQYPENELASIRASCKALKGSEEIADLIYHNWRKEQRRVLLLSLIEENNWIEILGFLEQTTDAAYHAALLLERITRYRLKQ